MESSSSKRAKAPGNVGPQCLVDGCSADLRQCREYHRRHKVCEAHSKTPMVTIAGREQRFCQQCSRFHSLVEFDEGKRSCRKRLDGHNRRRRKPQPEQATTTSRARIVSFSTPQILGGSSSSSAVAYPWAGVNYMDTAATGGFVDAASSSSGSHGALSLLSSREFGFPQTKQLPLHLPSPLPLPLVNNATIGAGQYHHHHHHHHQSNDDAAAFHFPQEETSSPHHTLSFMWE